MDSTGNFPKAGGAAADKAAGAVKDGLRSAQQGLGQAANSATGKLDQMRAEATPAVEKAADKAAGAVKEGIRSSQQGLGQAAGSAAGKVEQLRDEAAPTIEKASAKAQEIGQKGVDALSDVSKQLRDRALEASDAAVAYAKDEPMKALLIAAAAGALLMGLLSMMVRSDE